MMMGHVPFSVPSLSKKNSTFQQVTTQIRYSPKILPVKFCQKTKENTSGSKKKKAQDPRRPNCHCSQEAVILLFHLLDGHLKGSFTLKMVPKKTVISRVK